MSNELSILVVDDENIVRLSCMRTLKPKGHHVESVTDGYEALSLLREKTFDIIITDLKMPNMNGIEFIAMLRQTTPDIKVLLVTGYATDEARDQAEAMGAHYLPKPFNPEELCQAIATLSDT